MFGEKKSTETEAENWSDRRMMWGRKQQHERGRLMSVWLSRAKSENLSNRSRFLFMKWA